MEELGFVNLEYEVPRGRLHLRKACGGRGTLKSCRFTGFLEHWESGKGHLKGGSRFGEVWLKKMPVCGGLPWFENFGEKAAEGEFPDLGGFRG